MPPVITAEDLEKEEAPPALDEDDIALLKTYVGFPTPFFEPTHCFREWDPIQRPSSLWKKI